MSELGLESLFGILLELMVETVAAISPIWTQTFWDLGKLPVHLGLNVSVRDRNRGCSGG